MRNIVILGRTVHAMPRSVETTQELHRFSWTAYSILLCSSSVSATVRMVLGSSSIGLFTRMFQPMDQR